MRSVAFALLLVACGSDANGKAMPVDAKSYLDAALPNVPNQWIWVPVEGTTCANGSTAGFGLNRAPTPGGDLFVYFEVAVRAGTPRRAPRIRRSRSTSMSRTTRHTCPRIRQASCAIPRSRSRPPRWCSSRTAPVTSTRART